MMSSSNQKRNNDDEGSWQKREVFRAVASALANNLVMALIALAFAVFALIRIGAGEWIHESVAARVVAALVCAIAGILGFILGAAYCLTHVGYIISLLWKRFIHQPPPQRPRWAVPSDFLASLGMMLTLGYWSLTAKQSELKKRRQLQAMQKQERATTKQHAMTRERRIAELEQELAALRALGKKGSPDLTTEAQ